MPKANGTLKTLLALAAIASIAIAGCYAYTHTIASRCQALAVAQSAANERDRGMRDDIQDIKHEQRRQSAKLDDILKKLP
jgi:outer membrane murein-binding lipoprotein Lpp